MTMGLDELVKDRMTITINTGNAAFADGYGHEVSRILHKLANDAENEFLTAGSRYTIVDSNGNIVGEVDAN